MKANDIEAYNAAWLQAWTNKDVDALCAFYAEDCVYKDPQTAAGLTGNEALRGYLCQSDPSSVARGLPGRARGLRE